MICAAKRIWRPRAAIGGALLIAASLISGCGTASLNSARALFYAGRFNAADEKLSKDGDRGTDRALVLLERGTIRQAAGKYEPSARDFDLAYDEINSMNAISISQDTGSMVVNDTVQDYRGEPFERTLMHAIDANNYLGLGKWDDAAVEARRITKSLEPDVRGDYPEDAYSRYVAGCCFELASDSSAASFEYRKANAVAKGPHIDDATGKISASSNQPPPAASGGDTGELICFVAMGRSPTGEDLLNGHRAYGSAPFAEIVANGRVLGRSINLADTAHLAFVTAQKEAFRKAAKTVARVAAKETIAHQLEKQDELLGAVARLILIGLLERPDTRRWETLPRWLQVARLPCPRDLREYDVIFRNSNGTEFGRQHIIGPLQRNGQVFVSFCRDITQRP